MFRYIKNQINKTRKGIPFNIFITNLIFQKIFRIDSNCNFSKNFTSRIMCPEKITIENESQTVLRSFAVSGNCYFQACRGIEVGENTIFSHGVTIVSMEHNLEDIDKIGKEGKVKIGKNCWLGAKCTILSGVELGNNTIVGANSVVTKSFKDGNLVIAGIPAAIIKKVVSDLDV